MNNSIQPWWRWLGCGLVSAQLFWLGFALLPSPSARADSVINSVHNLSASGPGSIKSSSENNPCIFCHTVHKAIGSSPLWNHTLSSVSNYVVYTSTRLQSLGITVPQPSGSSRLCLSCHDGTVALGSISSSVTPVAVFQNGAAITTLPLGTNNLGTDLSADHPISVDYDAAALLDDTLKQRSLINPAVPLELVNGVHCVQCTSCHNPHDDQFGSFLVMNNAVLPCAPPAMSRGSGPPRLTRFLRCLFRKLCLLKYPPAPKCRSAKGAPCRFPPSGARTAT